MDEDVKITIKVTKTDIKQGRPMEGAYCPIALAAQRTLGKDMRMGASLLYEPNKPFGTIVPERVQEWIKRFDTRQEVKPFQFTVVFNDRW